MSLNTLRKGQQIKIGATSFLVLQKLPDHRWQLRNNCHGRMVCVCSGRSSR